MGKSPVCFALPNMWISFRTAIRMISVLPSPSEIAHRLFDILRKLDEEGMEAVFSEVVPPEGMGLAVMNRLGRAAAFRTIQA